MNIAVCDSDEKSLKAVTQLISLRGKPENVKSFTSIFSLVTYLYDEAHGDVDLLIINTRVGVEDGIEAAGNIKGFYPQVNIIFYSEHAEDAFRIFEFEPLYFLGLPLDGLLFEKAMVRAEEKCSRQTATSMIVKTHGNVFKLDHQSIIYLESQGRKVIIHTVNGMWESNMTMDELVSKLPDSFFKCHRSYIINTDMLLKLDRSEVVLMGEMRIPLARSKVSELKLLIEQRN